VKPHPESTLGRLMQVFPQAGRLEWIGVRPRSRAPLTSLPHVEAAADLGLSGDHRATVPGSRRQVTLIQAEHLIAVARLLGRADVDPGLIRRNLVVSGINLLALKDEQFQIGGVVLECTGWCEPCSRMEANLGSGGYNAMRGHGGITARVLVGGVMTLGDPVTYKKNPRLGGDSKTAKRQD
jgi:MOSC domain-containing protein YiiM